MSDIASMVAELIAAGCAPDVAAKVVASAFVAGATSVNSTGLPVDTAAEKRREYDRNRKREKRNSTGHPPDSTGVPNSPLSSSINRKRGERLPPDWTPDESLRAFAKELGWSDSQIDSEAANFRDYWIAKPGSGGCKLDWSATWRKWVRSSKVKPAGPPATQADVGPVSGFYAKFGSEEQDAWDRYGHAKRGKAFPRDRSGGWRFPSQWPPGYTPQPKTKLEAPPIPALRTMQ